VRAAYQRAADGSLGWIAVKTDDHAAVAAAAWYLANLGEQDRALALCEQAEQADGDKANILFRAAQVHARTGNEATARERLERALAAGYPALVVAASPLLAPLLPDGMGDDNPLPDNTFVPPTNSGTVRVDTRPPIPGGT
jgi:tetratricopeptide (TPR) repeat protein